MSSRIRDSVPFYYFQPMASVESSLDRQLLTRTAVWTSRSFLRTLKPSVRAAEQCQSTGKRNFT